MRNVLADKRKEAGLTQEDTRKLLDISLSFYRKIEQGTRNPGLRLAQKIVKIFNTTVDEIFFENKGHNMCPRVNNPRYKYTGKNLPKSTDNN